MSANTWHHVALTHDGSAWTGYLDGKALGSVEQTFGSVTGLPLKIGGAGAGGFFQGALDELMIYNRALGASEIYPLSHDDIAGVNRVEIGLQPFDFDSPPSADENTTWYNTALGAQYNSQTSWQWTVPNNLEAFYHGAAARL